MKQGTQKPSGVQRARIEQDLADEIRRLALNGWSAAKIFRELNSREGSQARMPNVRTVERYVNSVRVQDDSGEWSLVPGGSENDRLVLDVLADVVEATQGFIRALTVAEASWVATIRRALREAPGFTAFRIARLYRIRKAKGNETADLDALVAFNPWQHGDEGWLRYARVLAQGWAPRPPLFLTPWKQQPPSMVRMVEIAPSTEFGRDMPVESAGEFPTDEFRDVWNEWIRSEGYNAG